MNDEKENKQIPPLAETAYRMNLTLMNIKAALERIGDELEKQGDKE